MKIRPNTLELDLNDLRAIANVEGRNEEADRDEVLRWAQNALDAALEDARERFHKLELMRRHERERRLRGAAAAGLFEGTGEKQLSW